MTIRTLIAMLPEVYEFYKARLILALERFVARHEAAELRLEHEMRMAENGRRDN